MPAAAPVGVGETSNVGSSTIAISPSRNIEVGEFLVVLLSERDWGISSLADNSTQTGTANSYTQNVLKNTQDPYCYIYSCPVTRKILTTDAITATFAGPNGGKGMCVLVLPDAASSAQFDKSSTMSAGGSATYWTNATATTAQADEYAVGVCAFAVSSVDAGTITTDSPWTQEFNGKPTSGYACVMGSLVLTATGTPEMTGGWGATHNGQQEGAIATYKATTVTVHQGVAALDLTAAIVTAGFALKRAVSAIPLTLGVVTAGYALKRATVSEAFALNMDTAGYALKRSSAAVPLTFTVETAGGRKTFSDAALALDLAISAAGFAKKSGAADLGLTFGVDSTGRMTAFAAADLPLTLTVAAAGYAVKRGTADLPLIFTIVSSSGAATVLGSAALDLTLAVTAAGFATKTGVVALPLVATIDTAGFAVKRGVADVPLTLAISSQALIKALASAALPLTLTMDTVGALKLLGAADLPLTLTITTAGDVTAVVVSAFDAPATGGRMSTGTPAASMFGAPTPEMTNA